MATLTIRNVPDDLYQRLKERARRNRRSLNQEVVMALESGNGDSERAAAFAEARAFARELREAGLRIDHAEIDAMIDEGRR